MPLPVFVKALAEKKIAEFCKNRVPPEVHHQLQLSYTIRGNNITLFEDRAPWREGLTEWTHVPVAQLRYDDHKAVWKLYCKVRNEKWWSYEPLAPTKDIDQALRAIDSDPTGIFWG